MPSATDIFHSIIEPHLNGLNLEELDRIVALLVQRRKQLSMGSRYQGTRASNVDQGIAARIYAETIAPHIAEAGMRDIDELIYAVGNYRRKAATGEFMRPISEQQIGASLVTTGILRENPLTTTSSSLVKISGAHQRQYGTSGSEDNIGQLYSSSKTARQSVAAAAAAYPDLIASYNGEAVLSQRLDAIEEMLNSPPGAFAVDSSASKGIAARIGGKGRAGNPVAFRMRSPKVYSHICGSLVEFH